MIYGDEGQAQYEAEMAAAAEYDHEAEMNANEAAAEAEQQAAIMEEVKELEAQIDHHERIISELHSQRKHLTG